MLSMLRRPRGRNNTSGGPESTKSIARERLQNALNRDRSDLVTPDVMEAISRDMVAALSRHLEVGDEFHELEVRRLNQSLYLVASIRIHTIPRWAALG